MSVELLETIIRYLWISTRYNVQQITIAVDDIPNNNVLAESIMLAALTTSLRLRSVYKNKIELHLTMNSIKTIDQYIDRGITQRYIAQNVDLLSFSHLSEEEVLRLKYIRSFTRVNYNYMPSENLDNYKKMLSEVDMSYYLLYKTGLGRINDPRAIEKFKSGINEIKHWAEKDKIIIDGCVRDAVKYLSTGFGCSSNVSRIHIWPDGHVTGCPYNKDGGKPAQNMTQIIDNIDETMEKYEFRSCSIPRDYFSKQPTLRVIN